MDLGVEVTIELSGYMIFMKLSLAGHRLKTENTRPSVSSATVLCLSIRG
jgi:hypothetical protein